MVLLLILEKVVLMPILWHLVKAQLIKWYRYNDTFVNPITDLQKEVIDFSIPYILFYQKV